MKLNTVTFAAMPSAIVIRATEVNPGVRRNVRNANRMSWANRAIMAQTLHLGGLF